MTAIDTSTAAVTALMDGVTDGPWYLSSGHMQANGHLYWQVETEYDAVVNNQFCWAQGDHAANARFIAAARQLVPALLAERDAADHRAGALLARVAALEDAIAVKGGNENYPTEDAYLAACSAIKKHRARAEKAEARVAALENALRGEIAQRDRKLPMLTGPESAAEYQSIVAEISIARAASDAVLRTIAADKGTSA